eukprot:scaffold63894_cov59-Phaeocystis_antarctica.AAC.3
MPASLLRDRWTTCRRSWIGAAGWAPPAGRGGWRCDRRRRREGGPGAGARYRTGGAPSRPAAAHYAPPGSPQGVFPPPVGACSGASPPPGVASPPPGVASPRSYGAGASRPCAPRRSQRPACSRRPAQPRRRRR